MKKQEKIDTNFRWTWDWEEGKDGAAFESSSHDLSAIIVCINVCIGTN